MLRDRGAGIDIREMARGIMIVCVVVEWCEEARRKIMSCRVRQRKSRCHHTTSCTPGRLVRTSVKLGLEKFEMYI
jgi:hypothetical protein